MDDEAIAAAAAEWRAKPVADLPVPLDGEQYLEAEQAYAAGLAPLYPRVQLLRFGEWGTLGISDIDLVCVVDDDIDVESLRRIEAIPRSPLIVHPPIVLSRSMLHWFRWFLPGAELRAVDPAYPVPEIHEPDAREFADLCLISAFDTSLMTWRGFALARGAREEPRLRVRSALLKLWTIRHTINYTERGGVPAAPEWRAYAEDCEAMRAAFRAGEPIDVDRLAWNLARAERYAREVATAGAAARRERSNAPAFAERIIESGRTRIRTDREPWRVRRGFYPLSPRISYLLVSLPRDVAAFVAQTDGDSPFDRTLRINRELWKERTGFMEKHDIYALWSGKQFLGSDSRTAIARFRDRTMLKLISATF